MAAPVKSLARNQDFWLSPDLTIKEALARFERAESDALAVLDGADTRKVIGVLTEAHALRRYGEELERRSREILYS
jgi:CIC family chloride channel protein